MTIEIVDFPIQNGGSFHSYVSLPEGRFTFFFRYKKSPQHQLHHPGFLGMNREETWESPKCTFGFRGCEIAMRYI